MKRYAKLFLTSAVIFLVIDLLWLAVISRQLYVDQLGGLMGETRIIPAAIFYVLFMTGLLFFVIVPALNKNKLSYAILVGGFFGLICYGTYDLTNLATLENWPVVITVLDLIWGTFINAATAGLVFWIAKRRQW
ncbi:MULTISPECIES: DUF2177 family protein [Brochothrix]|uniref:DUF2177 domain-containing protein n=1 Tax=Brochothrix thermosphacta TaxID=2756 RepID=A0A1D2KSM3_BROTH|nr:MULTISPECIES: DUF2177 family protein [Brochothrix]SLM96427.1 hypothetical protein FM106_11525 [Brachybacterium faecium]ANZ96004.1 hypothetical protein BFC19_11700 [Brochothrix thermosphacta]ANZ97844.1 hypothetical protein BFC20_09135 [Brochothrix thermosphacta]ATF25015.1 DUF2177 domain-containing protein [Brochothrix thermosphacta]ATH84431.1 DUF2177 domain-containing protein [Brochothrix thermosphacta]